MPKLNDFLFILPNIIPGKNRCFAALSQFGLFGNQTTTGGGGGGGNTNYKNTV